MDRSQGESTSCSVHVSDRFAGTGSRPGSCPSGATCSTRGCVSGPSSTDDERARLEGLTLRLIAEKSWEPANGFELADEIMVTIAAEASLIALGLPDDVYRDVHSIIVHPTTLVLTGEHSQVAGLVSDEPMPILGQADYQRSGRHRVGRGARARPVIPATGTTSCSTSSPTSSTCSTGRRRHTAARHPGRVRPVGRGVHRVYDEVVAGRAGAHPLRSYAGVNPAEFFAVATEVFFDDPEALHREHVDLYDVLRGYYRQDPLSRIHGADRHA